jgi:hypothetical protein
MLVTVSIEIGIIEDVEIVASRNHKFGYLVGLVQGVSRIQRRRLDLEIDQPRGMVAAFLSFSTSVRSTTFWKS